MTERTHMQRLADAHATSPDPKAARRRRERAATYRPSPELDRLIELRDSERERDRALFDRIITPATRMALGTYEAAKAAHAEENA